MNKKIFLSIVFCCVLTLTSCKNTVVIKDDNSNNNQNANSTIDKADTSDMNFSFDSDDTTPPIATDSTTDLSNVASDSSSQQNINTYNITSGGVYTFTGEQKDVMLLIDAENSDVTIILNGVTINNSLGPAIYVRSADKVTISLSENSVNTLSDGSSYNITDSDSTLDGVIFSKSDLTINGDGTLNVNGNYKHGIVSKDDLIISSGVININAQNVALSGKDCVKINSGNLNLTAGSDGIRSDNTEDTSKGYIYLNGGTINITAQNDGIQSETVTNIENVNLNIVSGTGSTTYLTSSTESYKGIKAGSDIYITGGNFNIDSTDDCIHSNGTITISGGNYTLSSGDDGIHADTDLEISGESTVITVNQSYEGIEATNLIISGGDISIVATDDGLNAAGGNNSASTGGFARPGQNKFSGSSGSISILGGNIKIYMSGDGIDANGTLNITGGNITVTGANKGDTAILDFDSTGTISGGTFIGTGASSMAQNFSTSSTQGVIFISCQTQSSGTAITLTDSNGNTILNHSAENDFSCAILSHSSIKKGETYTLKIGSNTATITMTSTVYGSSNGMGGGMNGGMGGRPF